MGTPDTRDGNYVLTDKYLWQCIWCGRTAETIELVVHSSSCQRNDSTNNQLLEGVRSAIAELERDTWASEEVALSNLKRLLANVEGNT